MTQFAVENHIARDPLLPPVLVYSKEVKVAVASGIVTVIALTLIGIYYGKTLHGIAPLILAGGIGGIEAVFLTRIIDSIKSQRKANYEREHFTESDIENFKKQVIMVSAGRDGSLEGCFEYICFNLPLLELDYPNNIRSDRQIIRCHKEKNRGYKEDIYIDSDRPIPTPAEMEEALDSFLTDNKNRPGNPFSDVPIFWVFYLHGNELRRHYIELPILQDTEPGRTRTYSDCSNQNYRLHILAFLRNLWANS